MSDQAAGLLSMSIALGCWFIGYGIRHGLREFRLGEEPDE